MIFGPAWIIHGKASDIERQLTTEDPLKGTKTKFKFSGPGTYLSNTDTVIIFPTTSSKEITPETLWHWEWPEDTIFEALIWNTPSWDLVTSYICQAPTRMDERN